MYLSKQTQMYVCVCLDGWIHECVYIPWKQKSIVVENHNISSTEKLSWTLVGRELRKIWEKLGERKKIWPKHVVWKYFKWNIYKEKILSLHISTVNFFTYTTIIWARDSYYFELPVNNWPPSITVFQRYHYILLMCIL